MNELTLCQRLARLKGLDDALVEVAVVRARRWRLVCRQIGFRVSCATRSRLCALDVRDKTTADSADVIHLPYRAALGAQELLDSETRPCALTLALVARDARDD